LTAFTRPTLLALLALMLTLALPGAAQAATAEELMVQHINKAREHRGKPPLRFSGSLTVSSRRFGRTILRTDRFGHAARIRASRRFRRLGEILAYHRGYRARIRSTVRRWLRSPGHRRVMLSTRFRYVGAGKARGRLGRVRATTWVAQFGR
jgi:uncharacterized protein YkwD